MCSLFNQLFIVTGINPFPTKDEYICSWQKLHFFKEGAGA